eukprot:s5862_g3.t1
MLSFAAKFGLSPETRLQLGYHTSGFRMVHTYSRDAAAQPLMELEKLLVAVREKRFLPDCTRSGRFVGPSQSHEPDRVRPVAEQSLGPRSCAGPEVGSDQQVIDLTDMKVEVTDSEEEAPSSSSDESAEEFPVKQGRIFVPPQPPEGYVFWQHRKLRTLHLTRPDYTRVFMCNRMIGQLHSREGMIIRYDTPVCRQCAAAVKA